MESELEGHPTPVSKSDKQINNEIYLFFAYSFSSVRPTLVLPLVLSARGSVLGVEWLTVANTLTKLATASSV